MTNQITEGFARYNIVLLGIVGLAVSVLLVHDKLSISVDTESSVYTGVLALTKQSVVVGWVITSAVALAVIMAKYMGKNTVESIADNTVEQEKRSRGDSNALCERQEAKEENICAEAEGVKPLPSMLLAVPGIKVTHGDIFERVEILRELLANPVPRTDENRRLFEALKDVEASMSKKTKSKYGNNDKPVEFTRAHLEMLDFSIKLAKEARELALNTSEGIPANKIIITRTQLMAQLVELTSLFSSRSGYEQTLDHLTVFKNCLNGEVEILHQAQVDEEIDWVEWKSEEVFLFRNVDVEYTYRLWKFAQQQGLC